MKNVFKFAAMLAGCLIMSVPLSAKSGVDLGYLNSSYRSKAEGSEVSRSEPMNGFFVGVANDIRLFAGLSIQPGLYYSYLNSSGSEEEIGFKVSDSYTEHMLSVPIHFKYTFDIVPMFGINIFVGPTLSFGLAANNKMTVTGDVAGNNVNGSVTYNAYSGKFRSENLSGISDQIIETINRNMPQNRMNRFDVLMGGGVGLDLLRFITVKGGFDYGLMNRLKDDDGGSSLNRLQYYISIGVRF